MKLLGYLYEPQENISQTIETVSNEMEGTLTTILKQNPEINTIQGLLESLLKTIESLRINQTNPAEHNGQYIHQGNLDIQYKVESDLDKILQKYAQRFPRAPKQ